MSVSHSSRVLRLERTVYLSVCEHLDTPRSLTCWMLANYGEWNQLVNLRCDPTVYLSGSAFEDDYLVTEMLKKNPRLPLNVDREQVTLQAFERWEAVCLETNERLAAYWEGNVSPLNRLSHRAIHYAREWIRSLLGSSPSRAELHFAEQSMRFGPGATTSLSGDVTAQRKYSQRVLHVTPRLSDFAVWCHPLGWQPRPDICLVTASKFRQVPKNAKTNRGICIEPDLNVYVQLGCGAVLRERLRRASIDLDDQGFNRWLAANAVDLDLATVDLSGASDCVSRELVLGLLPDAWSHLLWLSRVDETALPDGRVVHLEKWSSMGNGYTFELESILFRGIAEGCLRALNIDTPYVTAYGDDIVVPTAALPLLVDTLEFLGFSVNPDKTFGKGPFRESCGADYWNGRPVRPFYLRSESDDFTEVCYTIANAIRRWAHRRNGGLGCDSRMLPAWLRVFVHIADRDRHRIPEGFGDVGLISNFDEASPSVDRHTGNYLFRFRKRPPVDSQRYPLGAYVASLAGRLSPFSRGREALRGRFGRAATKRGATLKWPNLGPWY